MRNGLSYSEAGKLGAESSKNIIALRVKEREERYHKNPKQCMFCDSAISYLNRRNKFCCHSCSASYNNHGVCRNSKRIHDTAKIKRAKFIELTCEFCGTIFKQTKHEQRFCKASCSSSKRKFDIFKQIESNTFTGYYRKYREYLIWKFGAKCMRCGWDEVNVMTNKCPIELEHKDGNSSNNKLDNLELLCPNCHSLTATYKALNKGNGRHKRRIRYREGKSY